MGTPRRPGDDWCDGDPGGYFAIRQTLFVVLGALAAWVVYRLDRPALMALAAVGYAGSVLGLLARCSRRWARRSTARISLADPARWLHICSPPVPRRSSWFCWRRCGCPTGRDAGLNDPLRPQAVLGVLAATGVVAGLLLLQPDLGSAFGHRRGRARCALRPACADVCWSGSSWPVPWPPSGPICRGCWMPIGWPVSRPSLDPQADPQGASGTTSAGFDHPIGGVGSGPGTARRGSTRRVRSCPSGTQTSSSRPWARNSG